MRPLAPHRRPASAQMAAELASVPVAGLIEPHELRAALLDPKAPHQPHARRLMEEASAPLLAGLVLDSFVDWSTLAEAAERYPPADNETAAWIRDMARLVLA